MKYNSTTHVPLDVRALEKKRKSLTQEQSGMFTQQNFERVAEIRQEIITLDQQMEELNKNWKEQLTEMNACVTEEDISNVVATWTGIPVNKIKETESEKLKYLFASNI